MDNLDCRQVLDAQDDLVRDRLSGGARVGGHTSRHHLDDLTHGRGSRLNRADPYATHEADLVSSVSRHAVRNEDQMVVGQAKSRTVQTRLGRRQRSRGLVHDEIFESKDSASNLHHLQTGDPVSGKRWIDHPPAGARTARRRRAPSYDHNVRPQEPDDRRYRF